MNHKVIFLTIFCGSYFQQSFSQTILNYDLFYFTPLKMYRYYPQSHFSNYPYKST